MDTAIQISKIIGVAIAALAFGLAAWHYRRQAKADALKTALELRRFFRDFEEIHKAFRDGGKYSQSIKGKLRRIDKNDWSEIDAYLGSFEIIYHACKQGVLPREILENQYKFRLENILRHPDIRDEIKNPKENWADLKALLKMLKLEP